MRMNDSLTDLVSLNKEGIAVTTSLILAKGLKRRHSDVLRSIDCLTRDICGREGDYILSHYSSNGKKYRIYEITKDGLTLFHVRNPKTFGIFMERVLGEYEPCILSSIIDKAKLTEDAIISLATQIIDNRFRSGYFQSILR